MTNERRDVKVNDLIPVQNRLICLDDLYINHEAMLKKQMTGKSVGPEGLYLKVLYKVKHAVLCLGYKFW